MPQEKDVEVEFQNGWRLHAGKVLVATNGFARHLFPNLQVNPARNQVLITRPLPGLALKGTFHMNEGYVYFRNVGNRLLLGGFRHLDIEGESTDAFGLTPTIQKALHTFMSHHLLAGKHWETEDQWSGILGVGPQKKPIIQEVLPGVWAAVRLGGMGVAIGSLVGEEAAELVAGSW